MENLQSAFGIFALLALAWIVSEDRRGVAWGQAAVALLVTFVTAVILLKVPGATRVFAAINDAVDAIAAASRAGTSFVFGYLGGGQLPYELKVPGAEFVLALQALPILLVMSVSTTLLFHWRILPPLVHGFSWLLERTLKVGGAVGLSTAANIFLGMVEAPLFIRPYLASLTRSELFIVMTGGMAGIAGTVLVIYATLLGPLIPDAAAHFVIASVMGAAGRHPRQPDHGAGAHRSAHRRRAGRGGKGRLEHHGRHRAGHRRRPRTSAQHLRHADRAGRLGPSRQCDHRPPARRRRRADHAATLARLLDGAGVLAHRCSLEGGGDGRQLDGDQDDSQRVHRLCGALEAASRRARSARAPDHALRHVWFRQFRLARHHDRGTRHYGAGAARRRALARRQVDCVGDDRDLPDGRDRGRADLSAARDRARISAGGIRR